MRVKELKGKEIIKKLGKYISILLFVTMLVLIYMLSPRITQIIQDLAKYLYELDSTYITRVVELLLSTSMILAVLAFKNKK